MGKDAANDFLGENLFSEIENNMVRGIPGQSVLVWNPELGHKEKFQS